MALCKQKFYRFVNLGQDEADNFNHGRDDKISCMLFLQFLEFKSRANRNISGMFGGHSYTPERRAIEAGRNHHPSSRPSEPRQSGSAAPIITVPSDDEDEEIQEIRTTT